MCVGVLRGAFASGMETPPHTNRPKPWPQPSSPAQAYLVELLLDPPCCSHCLVAAVQRLVKGPGPQLGHLGASTKSPASAPI